MLRGVCSAVVAGLAVMSAGCDRASEAVAPPVESKPATAPVERAAPEPEQAAPAALRSAAQPGECATARACDAQASAQERGGDPERAASLYARACELGLGTACHRLGELHRDGKGVPADDDQARALFTRGCQQGSNAACDALGH
jgi:TPR repeat protein